MNDLVTYVLVNDPHMCERVDVFLKRLPHINVINTISGPSDAGELLLRGKADLLLMDMDSPHFRSMKLSAGGPAHPAVVLLGSTADAAVQAFNFGAIDFLLKPFSFRRFQRAMMRAARSKHSRAIYETDHLAEGRRISLKQGRKTLTIDVGQLQLVQGMGNYSKLHMLEGNVLVSETMTHMQKLLGPDRFVRIHRSYLIAPAAVISVGARSIAWRGGELPIGGSYKDRALAMISTLAKEPHPTVRSTDRKKAI